MSSDISAVIARAQVQALFQPILDGTTAEAFGFEALTRGPLGSPLEDALRAVPALRIRVRVK